MVAWCYKSRYIIFLLLHATVNLVILLYMQLLILLTYIHQMKQFVDFLQIHMAWHSST